MRLIFTALTLVALLAPARAADLASEDQFIAVLQSDAGPQQKDAACALLKRIGTARAVPALAALLADDQLSHAARYALESMPAPEAGRALIAALEKCSGLTQTGLVISIGNRREAGALPALAKLVSSSDPDVAAAAAVALGKIGGPAAVTALKAGRTRAPAPVQQAITDGLLRCAEQRLTLEGRRSVYAFAADADSVVAAGIYLELLESKDPRTRTAACRGLILASDKGAAAIALKALQGSDPFQRIAALQLVAQIPGPAATKLLAESLASLPPDIQASVIDGLRDRGDAAAVPAILDALKSPSDAVRIAAVHALGAIGDVSVILPLASAAAASKGVERDAARTALDRLRGRDIAQSMLITIARATPDAQTELILSIGRRRETSAAPTLLQSAGTTPGEAQRTAALQSLALTADETVAAGLVTLLVKASTDAARDAIENALLSLCARSKHSDACAAPVINAILGAPVPVRCALLRILGHAGGSAAIDELRIAAHDADPAIQDTAIRSLAGSERRDAMPELLVLAKGATNLSHRVIALRGYWAAVSRANASPVAERLQLCAAGLKASARPDEKRLGLKELARIPDPGALKLAEPYLTDPAVGAEAASAIIQIAHDTPVPRRNPIKVELARLLGTTADANTRRTAETALTELEPDAGAITVWEVAGPYKQAGKTCRALFDIPFPPETAEAAQAHWHALPPGSDTSKPWLFDLLKALGGGDQCVAYVRTAVVSDKARPARLDIGSDDGVKVWLNGELVHANNTTRPLTPASDRVAIQLQKGRNTLLMKITQNNLGWEFCARIVKPDGAPLRGLRFEIAPAQ